MNTATLRDRFNGAHEVGTYILLLRLRQPASISIGRLGRFDMAAGYYAYIGSAFGPGGLPGRLHHHVRPVRRPHWHIDYLRAAAPVQSVWYAIQQVPREHAWAGLFETLPQVVCPIPGFGSSDCRCHSHLFYSQTMPDAGVFAGLIYDRFPCDSPLTLMECETDIRETADLEGYSNG
jgi:Uri superfamily endonuclease